MKQKTVKLHVPEVTQFSQWEVNGPTLRNPVVSGGHQRKIVVAGKILEVSQSEHKSKVAIEHYKVRPKVIVRGSNSGERKPCGQKDAPSGSRGGHGPNESSRA